MTDDTQFTDEEIDLATVVAKELQAQPERTIVVEVGLVEAMTIVSQLQLALRHPGNKGQAADCAANFARGLQESIQTEGPIFDLLEAGWRE